MKKIVFVIADLGAGGAQRVMALLANALAAADLYEITVLSTAKAADSFYPYEGRIHVQALDIESAGGRFWAGVAVNIKRVRALRRFFKAQQPDVVISFLAETNALVLLGKAGLPVPVIISERSDPYFYPASRLWRALRALTYRGADLLVCQTRYAAGFFGSAVRTAVIPNPVFAVTATQSTPPVSGPYVLGVGRLSAEKGFDVLIKAHRQALDHVPDLKLVLVGDGPERAALVALAQQCGSASQVVFAGAQKDMTPYFTHARAFILPSQFEGVPNALLEAMAHGVPSIVTPGFRAAAEIITSGHNGILLDRLALAEIAGHIVDLCQIAHKRQAMGAAAMSGLHNFEPERVFAQWRAVIEAQTGSA
ncbi:MAG TPA: glycosyltransferase [Micavibrio sp.]